MRNVSRRTILKAAGVAAVAAALPRPQVAFAASASTDDAALLNNVIASLAGTAKSNSAAAVQGMLTDLYNAGKKSLDAIIASPGTQLFPGLPLGTSDSNLTTTYSRLADIAVATAMPLPSGSSVPSDLSGNITAQNQVIDALSWLYDTYFGNQATGYYGNWYNWEIGIPIQVSRTLALLRDRVAAYQPELAARYVHAMDLYLRNGTNGDVDLDSRFHTGANLADITTNRIVQGAVLGDEARITKAISDQMTVYRTIDPYNLQHGVTDGFYPDGSFIQHASVAYTGSYGVGLLSRVTATIALLDGTQYATTPGLTAQINGWLANSFSPVIVQGWMMEMIKGRSISRTTTGYKNTVSVVESIVSLSAFATADSAASLKSYLVYLHDTPEVSIDPNGFTSPANVLQYSQITSDASVAARDLVPSHATFAYNSMDRNVHRRPAYTFALARSSARVSKYEYMSGENLMPWFQGDGAYYVYLSGDDQTQAYGVDFLTAVEPYRLPGVTSPVEERKTIPELYGELFYDNPDAGFTSSSVLQNTYVYFPLGTNQFSGSTHLGAYAVAGMVQSDDAAYAAKQQGALPGDFVAYANARSVKSWFMLDDEIVVLAAGITDPHGREVVTTIDSRIADVHDALSVSGRMRDGSAFNGSGTLADPDWLLYSNQTRGNNVGYLFLDDNTVDVRSQGVQRNLRLVRTSNPNRVVSKNVFDLSVTHPASAPEASVAYAIVPHASASMLESYRQDDDGPSVVANSSAVQAIRHRGLRMLAANVFAEQGQRVGGMAIDGPASVIAQADAHGGTVIAVSDPTFARDRVSVTIPGRRAILDADGGVGATPVTGGTRLDFDTHHAYGATISATVRGGGIV